MRPLLHLVSTASQEPMVLTVVSSNMTHCSTCACKCVCVCTCVCVCARVCVCVCVCVWILSHKQTQA